MLCSGGVEGIAKMTGLVYLLWYIHVELLLPEEHVIMWCDSYTRS